MRCRRYTFALANPCYEHIVLFLEVTSNHSDSVQPYTDDNSFASVERKSADARSSYSDKVAGNRHLNSKLGGFNVPKSFDDMDATNMNVIELEILEKKIRRLVCKLKKVSFASFTS